MSTHPPEEEYKYWAFISYSHADQNWADWLHKSLETYGVPKVLVGRTSKVGVVPKRAYPIFRDRDELPSSADLGEKLTQALMQSRYLIVICSPRAVASRWVNEEIKSFKSIGREDRVLCLIVDGEPYASEHPELGLEECFPEPVRYKVDANKRITEERTEPIAADARRGKDGRENAKLKLLAGMFGVNFSDLKQRDAERRHRRMQLALVVVMLVMCGFLVLAGQAILAKKEAEGARASAERQREEALNQKAKADKARAAAEEAKKIADDAKTKAEDALASEAEQKRVAQLAREEAVKSADEAKRQAAAAEKARNEEAVQREAADKAKADALEAARVAERAKEAAEQSERKVSRALSVSYFVEAGRLIGDNRQPQGMAYLSRSLKLDSENASAQARVMSLLGSRNWPLPRYEALHTDAPVVMTRFSPDAKLLLVVSGNQAQIFDASNPKESKTLTHPKAIRSAQFSPDSSLVVTTSDDGTAQLWKTATGQKQGAPLKHGDWVYSASFSADGKALITASHDKSARVWNVATGQPITEPLKTSGSVRWATISADGKLALTTSDSTAQVWDAEKGQPIGPALAHDGGVYYASFSPDAKFVATASGDKTAKIWGMGGTNAAPQVLKHDDWVNQVKFTPDGRFAVTCSSDGTAKVWEVPTGKQIGQTIRHAAAINMISISPNVRMLATASADRTARLWDLKTGAPLSEPMELGGEVKWVSFSPDGLWVTVGGADAAGKGITRVWTAVERRPLSLALNHDTPILQAMFNRAGDRVLTVADDRTVRVWDVATGQLVGNPMKHDYRITTAIFSPDGKFVATASDRYARVWDAETGVSVGQPMAHDRQVNTVSFRKDGQVLLTASDDGTARLWNAADGKQVGASMQHDRAVRMASFSSDGKKVLTASADKTAKLWDGSTGKFLGTTLTHKGELRSAVFSPDGRMVATASDDRTARVWLTDSGEALTPELRHDAVVNAVAFSGDQKYVVTVSDDKTARVWTADGGRPAAEPLRHDAEVKAVSFSSNGYFLVTVSKSNAAMVWDTASWKPVTEPLKHDGLVRDAGFSGDGRFIITASEDKTARLWLVALPGTVPDWFRELTEGVAGYQLGEEGGANALPDSWTQIASVRKEIGESSKDDVFANWAEWYLAPDPLTRSVMAFTKLPTKDYLAQRLAADDSAIDSVLLIQPNNALALARYGRAFKDTTASDYYTSLAVQYEPQNPEVLWLRAGSLQAANQFEPAYELMTKALSLDVRAGAVIGAEGAEVNLRNRDNNFSHGWLPKGWVDRNRNVSLSAEYTKLTDGPSAGTPALGVKTTGSFTVQCQLAGPRFIARNREKQTIHIWAKSDKRTDFLLSARSFLDPNERAFDLQVRPTDKWQEFKLTVSPSKDFAGEVLLFIPGDGSVQIGGVQVSKD